MRVARALTGAIQYARPGFHTQRYQHIVVLALLGCHGAGQSSPVGLLDQLAAKSPRGLAPSRPSYWRPSSASFVATGD